jgi:SIR2-like domain
LMKSAELAEGEIAAISKWPSLDQAEYVERALRTAGKELGREVAALLKNQGHPNLALTLAANLPVEGLITTNYDQLFEDAVKGLGMSLAILPYAPSREANRWLLKMHGSIDHQDDIVLTRRSYNRYAERNQALAGIVQAMLITRRMLFLGFSLSDDNFLRIVDAVRSAVSPEGVGLSDPQLLGTALMLKHDPALERHWADELVLYSPSLDGATDAENSRRMEIFLDYLLFCTASTKHLLNPRFWDALDSDEQLLAKALGELATQGPKRPESAAWLIMQETFNRFGGLPTDTGRH